MRLRGRGGAPRHEDATTVPGRGRRFRRALLGVVIAGFGIGGTASTVAQARSAGPELRIAIVPFVGDDQGAEIAQQLSVRFTRLGVARLLAPGSFVAEREFDPRAEAVRTWAYQAAVDTIVVGRVDQPQARSEVQQIEAAVRSGHSGAELFRHTVHVPARAGLGSALDQLAAAIVRDLGGDPLAADESVSLPPTPAVSARPEPSTERVVATASDEMDVASEANADNAANAPDATDASPSAASAPTHAPQTAPQTVPQPTPETAPPSAPPTSSTPVAPASAAPKSTKGQSALETRLGVGGFKSDAPIEIKADEAEIMAEGADRKLVFKGGVFVKQDNVMVHSDLLEAEYEEGQSEPTRLVATGRVHVEQDNRSARCERAEYLRVTQKITCRGHAELVQGCDVVRGELIVLELAGNKARVEGAASIVISPKQNGSVACQTPGKKP